jgi:glycerate-2-kinase
VGDWRSIAIGKAAARFAAAFVAAAPNLIDEGLVVVKEGHVEPVAACRALEASHPVPDARSLAAGEAVLRFAAAAREVDRHVVLLSGGASALAVAPIEGVSLADKIALTRSLLQSGAPIAAINAERSKRSRLKGGKLAAVLGSSASMVLAISDVEGDDPAVIASGPMTAPNGSDPKVSYALVATPDDALAAFAASASRAGCAVRTLGRTFYGDVGDARRPLACGAADRSGYRSRRSSSLPANRPCTCRATDAAVGVRSSRCASRVNCVVGRT